MRFRFLNSKRNGRRFLFVKIYFVLNKSVPLLVSSQGSKDVRQEAHFASLSERNFKMNFCFPQKFFRSHSSPASELSSLGMFLADGKFNKDEEVH